LRDYPSQDWYTCNQSVCSLFSQDLCGVFLTGYVVQEEFDDGFVVEGTGRGKCFGLDDLAHAHEYSTFVLLAEDEGDGEC